MRWAPSLVGVVVGAVLAYLTLGRPAPPADPGEREVLPPRMSSPTFVHAAPGAVLDPQALREAVREAVRLELAAHESARGATTATDDGPSPRADAGHRAEAVGLEAVEAATTLGRWTDADNEHLHAALAELDPPAMEAISAAWVQAVNRQQLRPEAPLRF